MKDSLRLFKALGDGTRLRIVEFLFGGERCVCEIIPHAKRKQSTVSIQLAKLERLGVVTSRREGKKTLYRLSDKKIRKVISAAS